METIPDPPRTPEEHRVYWLAKYPDIPYGTCVCGCGQTTALADSTWRVRAYVKGCPNFYFKAGHSRRLPVERWEVRDCGYDTPCWVWLGSKHPKGYGQVWNRDKKVTTRAHTLFYEKENGPVPAGYQLDHLCRNPPCVRPDHLEPVTGTENVRRGRVAKTTHRGAEDIRRLYATGEHTQSELGKMAGLQQAQISEIVRGRAWR